jgi:sugar lactone lactonase YvrE
MWHSKALAQWSPQRSYDYKASFGLLYVVLSDVEAPYDRVNVYNARKRDPSPLATITDGISYPQSACVDNDGTLYVTNQGSGEGWISEYPLGKTKPSAIITSGMSGPGFCAIDGAGNLWVTNIYSPDVVEYEKGSTSPHATITKGISYPIGIAIDHFENLYVANHDGPSHTNVVVYLPKHNSPARTITAGVTWPCGIGVDAEATLYVTNINPGTIEEYRIGKSQPYREITKDLNGPAAVTFAKDGWFFVTNIGAQSGGSGPGNVVLEFAPGSMTPSRREISKGLYLPFGTAYYPPLLP